MSDWDEDIDDELLPGDDSDVQGLDLDSAGAAITGAVVGAGIGEVTGLWPSSGIPDLAAALIPATIMAYFAGRAWRKYAG